MYVETVDSWATGGSLAAALALVGAGQVSLLVSLSLDGLGLRRSPLAAGVLGVLLAVSAVFTVPWAEEFRAEGIVSYSDADTAIIGGDIVPLEGGEVLSDGDHVQLSCRRWTVYPDRSPEGCRWVVESVQHRR